MTAHALAWRTATRYKLRAALAVAGVAIIGALNFDMILLSRGLLASFAQMLDSAGFDVRVVGSTGLPMSRVPVPGVRQLVDELRGLPEIDDVVIIRLAQAVATLPDRPRRLQAGVTLIGTSESSAHAAWALVRGRDLAPDDRAAREPALVIARRLATLLDAGPGSIVQLRARIPGARSVLPAIPCRVVGVGDFSFESAGEYTIAMTMEGFQLVRGERDRDDADLVLVRSGKSADADQVVRAIAKLRPDLRAYSNEQVIAEFNRNGFAYFRQISAVLSTTTISFTVLLVATLLTVSVNQRLGEVAALRALGIARPRIAAALLWESALLVGVGGTVALPLGGLLARQLDHLLRQMPGLPDRLHFFVFEPRALVIHASVLVITAIAAALYPVWIATHLSIAQTLRREITS